MAKKTEGLDLIRECMAKTRGPMPKSCIGCELSKIPVPINMYQTDAALVVKAFIPGIKLNEMNISITPDTISIGGEHKEKLDIREDDYFCKEQRYGTFDRKITLPIPVQSDKVDIAFDDGVLTLTLPKADRAR